MKWKADQFCFFQETKIISRKSFSQWIYFLVHCLKIKRCPATDKVYQRNFLCLSFKTEPKIRILVILWYRQFVTHHNSRRLFLLMTVKENTVVKLKACGKGMCEGIKGNKSRKKKENSRFFEHKAYSITTILLIYHWFCFGLYQKSDTLPKHGELPAWVVVCNSCWKT